MLPSPRDQVVCRGPEKPKDSGLVRENAGRGSQMCSVYTAKDAVS